MLFLDGRFESLNNDRYRSYLVISADQVFHIFSTSKYDYWTELCSAFNHYRLPRCDRPRSILSPLIAAAAAGLQFGLSSVLRVTGIAMPLGAFIVIIIIIISNQLLIVLRFDLITVKPS